MMSACNIMFGGQELVLDASGALYWPQERMLVVSDLHLEKASFLARHGSLVAPYDTQDTLERLQNTIARYQPRELLLLGDSFHDREAWKRLDSTLLAMLERVIGSVEECRWIEGNHDVALMAHALRFEEAHLRHGLHFRHEYAACEQPQIIGHYHPKTSVSLHGQWLRGPCFVQAETLLIMPAFGSYTGGLNLQDAAFASLFSAPVRPYLMHRQSLYKLPMVLHPSTKHA